MNIRDIIRSLREKKYTYQEIGTELGLTKQRIHQIDTKYKAKKKELTEKRKVQLKQSIKKWRNKYPEKLKAHRKVFIELRAGRIKSEPCEVCGMFPTQAHHEDYSKPLNVIWLCKTHHVEADKIRSLASLTK